MSENGCESFFEGMMHKQFWKNLALLFVAYLCLQVACVPSQRTSMEKERKDGSSDISQLRKQIESFAVGEGDEAIFSKLEPLPRNDLISALNNLKQQAPKDDKLQVKIAFLMCRLNSNYDENREIIARSLSRPSPYYNLPPDEVIGFVGNLIRRGDKKLLPVVMMAAEWADGALSEGISDILYTEVMRDFDSALRDLANLPPPVRQKVYIQIKFALTEAKGRAELLNHLKSKVRDKNLGKVAEEMIHAIK